MTSQNQLLVTRSRDHPQPADEFAKTFSGCGFLMQIRASKIPDTRGSLPSARHDKDAPGIP